MKKYITVFLALTGICSVSFGAITNYVNNGTTDPDSLSTTNYIGTSGTDAASIMNIADLTVTAAGFDGGDGELATSSSSIDVNGGAGLSISDIDVTSITGQGSSIISGGKGGNATLTAASAALSAEANGGSAIDFSVASSSQELQISDGTFNGGHGGVVAGEASTKLYADGGNALSAMNGFIDIDSGDFAGGSGGTADSVAGLISVAGGRALSIYGDDYSLDALIDGVSMTGGAGGAVTNTASVGIGQASGGDAIFINSRAAESLFFSGGSFSGGAAGTAVFDTDTISDPLREWNYFGEAFGQKEDFGSAQGGDGLRIFNEDYVQYGATLTITNGSFVGGNGGVSINHGIGTSLADGGQGIFTDFVNVDISGGAFRGGAAGVANGEVGQQGAGVRVRDGNLTVSGGVFEGFGLWFESHYYDSTATITDGQFGDVIFTSTFDEFFNTERLNTADISGGTFGNVLFNGTSMNNASITAGTFTGLEFGGEADNTATVTGANIGSIVLSGNANNDVDILGSSVDEVSFDGLGVNTLKLNNLSAAIDVVKQYRGVADVSFNTDHMINNLHVSNGVMNISGTDLSIVSGNSYRLSAMDSRLNITDKLTVEDKGTLDLGFGQVDATDFLAESGSLLFSTYGDDGSGGVTNGMINGDNLTFKTGLTWTLQNDGSLTNSANLMNGFLLSSANTTITQDLDTADVVLEAEGNPEWSKGITGVTNYMVGAKQNLYATYGNLALDAALGAEGDFGNALSDITKIIEANPGTDFDTTVRSWGEAEAQHNLHEGYVRTPEVASVLIGMQAVFADQIKDRTGSFRQLNGFAGSAVPQGAAGPEDWYDNSVDWMREHMPSWNGRDAVRDASNDAPYPEVKGDPSEVGKSYAHGTTGKGSDYDAIKDAVHDVTPNASGEAIEVPETYQVWGRGYGTALDQHSTRDHVGYDASVGGGMVGVDKRFSNILLGLGGGYAHTILNGAAGNDAKANTGHAVGYFSVSGEHAYFDANLNYALSSVDTDGISALGYEGEYDASTVGFYVGGGFGISTFNDALLFTPEVSLLTTYFNRESYTEKSDLGGSPDKKYDSYDEWSYLSALGGTLSMIKHIESFKMEMEFQPEIRVHWLHEFNDEMDDDSYKMVGVPGGGQDIGVALQAREEDLLKVGTGVRFSKWDSDTTEFGLDLDGVFGQDYEAVIVSGKIMHRF